MSFTEPRATGAHPLPTLEHAADARNAFRRVETLFPSVLVARVEVVPELPGLAWSVPGEAVDDWSHEELWTRVPAHLGAMDGLVHLWHGARAQPGEGLLISVGDVSEVFSRFGTNRLRGALREVAAAVECPLPAGEELVVDERRPMAVDLRPYRDRITITKDGVYPTLLPTWSMLAPCGWNLAAYLWSLSMDGPIPDASFKRAVSEYNIGLLGEVMRTSETYCKCGYSVAEHHPGRAEIEFYVALIGAMRSPGTQFARKLPTGAIDRVRQVVAAMSLPRAASSAQTTAHEPHPQP